MALTRTVSILLLAGVLVVAYNALMKQPANNGSFDLPFILKFKEKFLPGSKIPLRLPRTGSAELDSYFDFMMAFFWQALDPKNVRAHLHAFHILGTLGGGFLLMVLEAHRDTSSGTFLVLTYVVELLGEALGVGLFTPIWCILHLSLTAIPTTKASLSAHKGHLQALGYAFALGHVGPTILTSVLNAEHEGWYSKQLWTILRLFHPVFVVVLWKVFSMLQGGPHVAIAGESAVELRLSTIRKFYLFAAMFSAIFHVATMGLLVTPYWIPGWLRADVVSALDLKTIVVPKPFWLIQKNLPFRDAVAIFLQWDDLCAGSSILLWSASLYVEALQHSASTTSGSIVNTILQAISITALAGPVAAGAFFLHERDSITAATASRKAVKQ